LVTYPTGLLANSSNSFPRCTWERGGLAAIGGTVGGGMAAGTVVVAAAPVAAATAVGYGIYKFAKWLKDD